MPRIAASARDAFYETRRQALADIALKLWAERGYDGTSVATIAGEAGIAKGTFYLYFETKGALLLEVLRRNSLVPNVLALIDDLKTRSLDEAVHGFVRGAWRHLDSQRDLLLVALREMPTHLAAARDAVARVLVPANAALARDLAARIGPERAGEISTVIAVRALVGMIVVTFLTQEILGAGLLLPVPEAEITKTIAEMFLCGVAPQKESAS
jgi:AcrR family transcriptional regulator